MHVHFAFWVAVALVAIVAVGVFKVLMARWPLPGLATLAAAI